MYDFTYSFISTSSYARVTWCLDTRRHMNLTISDEGIGDRSHRKTREKEQSRHSYVVLGDFRVSPIQLT